jgi:ribonuclease E
MSKSQMIINYVPGEECRVAIVEDGRLEELHVERFAQASRVGNVYAGVVVNVEPAIQAAFIDFGIGENGFLHVTDLHPRYFPGEDEETTERVGFKTPRRERPPIQRALRRGDEVIVQVLKEGVGTKGPAVTSYLSIPGRFLVMMPGMDRVGVSRKVEDEEERRKMRAILDQLDLPEGFGFILRTAGMDRTKAELRRDLAYLMRLWKDLEKREKAGPRGRPRLLYSESDLLVRALRDILTPEIAEVVIDNETALSRAARFMKIVSPRSSTRLLHYPGKTPIFHAFGIEKQIALMHAREVPLPSGGRLVIDQTEALVAIDVNSGRSRDSRDAETNAFQTNLEAADEICRQLRLRDMGGIVVNDLIDMRQAGHRKEVEARFRERLKRDRARTTIAPISEFGILEMTRQRMRPSHESVHFTDCPMCRGRGMLQKPDSVASDALRELAAVLDSERVKRVEMVVAPRVAGELLSSKRSLLGRIERTHGKHVDVRVSETVPVDRVTFYAYDAQGADIDLTQLPSPRPPQNLIEWTLEGDDSWAIDEAAEREAAEAQAEAPPEEIPAPPAHPIEAEVPQVPGETSAPSEERRGRRRRRRHGRDHRVPSPPPAGPADQAPLADEPSTIVAEPDTAQVDAEPMRPDTPAEAPAGVSAEQPSQPGGRRRRRRRRRGRGGGGPAVPPAAQMPPPPDQAATTIETGGEWGDEPAPAQAPTGTGRAEPPSLQGTPDRTRAAVPAPAPGASQPGQAPGENGDAPRHGRRRRRRRKGRGNPEQRAPEGGPAQGPAPSTTQAQPNLTPPPPPPVVNPPAGQPGPAPKVRTLYGAVRRRLSPGELKKRPPEE